MTDPSPRDRPAADRPVLAFSAKYDAAWSQRYFEKHREGLWRRLSNRRETAMLRRALRLAGEPRTVLDLPCGTGRFWGLLAEQPGRRVLAADYSRDMLATAMRLREPALTARVEPLQCSGFAIPLAAGAVDAVLCVRLLHHITEHGHRLALLRELGRVACQAVCVTLWLDGGYQAWRRRRLERRRPSRRYANRQVLRRATFEAEAVQAGLEVVGRLDLLPYYSLWSCYVLRPR